MSDRFYMQQAAHFKVSHAELTISLREGIPMSSKRVTRIDLNKELTGLLGTNIEGQKLSMPTLGKIVEVVKANKCTKVKVPEGKLKQPYIEAVCTCLGTTVDLDSATVKVMKAFLEAINAR
ncbi:hypothetical protein P13BB106kb_p027 [Pectobacterium phage DU_PP_V]|uniref:Uncharacterized protein n=1 Tax=Pectobacterium phage DU_PP_V TaxID=2041492 RepID=A0A2D2W6T4_9CAUD|nr:hypothetical protein HOS40_gp027 [Pectobacterium phage DU_PP_V]ATS94011.1 hypothetical protein P13BB106kb_p027 [Pectobacterium phage DU_PP_V]